MDAEQRALAARVERGAELPARLVAEASKVVVGQRALLEGIVIGLLSGGHVLLEGVPGLAKTLAVRTVAALLFCYGVLLAFDRLSWLTQALQTRLTASG